MYWKFDPFKGALYLTGDVDGPASATNNAIPRYSGTSGKTVKASGIIIDDSNNMSGIGAVTITVVFDTTAAGTLNIGTGNASIINIGTLERSILERLFNLQFNRVNAGTFERSSLVNPVSSHISISRLGIPDKSSSLR